MATITATIDRNSVPGVVLATWADLATNDVGAGVPIAYAAELTGQVSGTFGGGTITWQGSNDNTNWHPLTQRSGTTNMAFTAAAVHTANENPAWIRPAVTSGTSVAIDCTLAIHARYAKAPY
jgi:uncharacterized protein YgfB (UPF0149 family)